MVALQEVVESGAFNEVYPNIVVNLTVLPENEVRQTITQDVTTQSGQFDVFTIGPFEVPCGRSRAGWRKWARQPEPTLPTTLPTSSRA